MPTPPREDVTLGEVVRRLDEVVKQLTALTVKLDETYLRRDVYEVQHTADDKVVKELRFDLDAIVDQQRQTRRLALSGIVLPVLATILAALILATVLP
jgi:hypothetical protein